MTVNFSGVILAEEIMHIIKSHANWLTKDTSYSLENKYIKFHNFADEDGVSSSIDLLINNIIIWQLHVPHFQYMGMII